MGGASSATGVTLIHPNMSIRARAFGPSNIIRSKDEFPALGSTGGGGGSGGIGSGGGNNYDPGNFKIRKFLSISFKYYGR